MTSTLGPGGGACLQHAAQRHSRWVGEFLDRWEFTFNDWVVVSTSVCTQYFFNQLVSEISSLWSWRGRGTYCYAYSYICRAYSVLLWHPVVNSQCLPCSSSQPHKCSLPWMGTLSLVILLFCCFNTIMTVKSTLCTWFSHTAAFRNTVMLILCWEKTLLLV